MKIEISSKSLGYPPTHSSESHYCRLERLFDSQTHCPVLHFNEVPRIAFVGDIHHNTLLLAEILKSFEKLGVNGIFLLGDYSSLSNFNNGVDISNFRYKQFLKVIELVRNYQIKNKAQILCIMGNHEIEDWYFSSSSNSRAEIFRTLKTLRRWGWSIPSNPFSGYEFRHGSYVTVLGNYNKIDDDLDCLRKFNIAHAISKQLVVSMYQGYPTQSDLRKKIQTEIEKSVGIIWRNYIDSSEKQARNLWHSFLNNINNNEIINQISINMRNCLSFDHITQLFINRGYDNDGVFNWLLKLPDEILIRMAYYWNLSNEPSVPLMDISKEYRHKHTDEHLFSFFSTLYSIGVGADYTISGHFHADIGKYLISQKFGGIGLAGTGFELGKVISKEFTCYVLELDLYGDTLYKLSTPSHMDGREHVDVDLSGVLKEII